MGSGTVPKLRINATQNLDVSYIIADLWLIAIFDGSAKLSIE